MSLRLRFLLLMSAIFCGFVFLTWLLSARLMNDINEKWGSQIVERQVIFDKYRTLSPLIREISLARKMAADPEIIQMALHENDPVARQKGIAAMERYHFNFSDHSYFAAMARSGNYYFNDAANQYNGKQLRYVLSPRNANDKWFYATIADGKDYQINLDPDVHLGVTKVWINVLVRKDEEILGVIGTGIDLTGFLKETVSIAQHGVHNLFIDKNMAIQLDNDPELIDFMSIAKDAGQRNKVDKLLKNAGDIERLRLVMHQLEQHPDRNMTLWVEFNDARYLLGVAYLPEVGWFDLTLMDSQSLALIENNFLAPVIFGSAFLIALIAMGHALRRWILDPISALQLSINKIQQGNFDVDAPDLKTGEMAHLSHSFASMAKYVRDSNLELENTVKKRTEELRRLVEEQSAILETRLVGIATLRRGNVIWANTAYETIFGYGRGELIGTTPRQIYVSDNSYQAIEAACANIENDGIARIQHEFVRKDGRHIWVDMNGTLLNQEDDETLWVIVDVTERVLAEQNQKRLARAVKLRSKCASTLVRAESEQELLAEISRLAVESGGYRMAWVGYAENDAARTVRPVAKSGYEEGYLDHINITWADSERGRGPAGTASRTGVTVVVQDFQTDPNTAVWREDALKRGYRSSIALPLIVSTHVLGVLCIYSAEAFTFGKDEVALLEELSNDLAYGIQTLRTRADHDVAERALKESMLKLEEKESAKTRFLAAAGHDMRQPLAAANLFIDALRDTAPTPDQEEIIRRLDMSMATFNGLLDTMLNISKLDAGMIKPEYTPINTAEIFNWLEQTCEPLASKKQLGFKLFFPIREAIVVRSDSGLVKSALMNLVSNAIKYTHNGAILIGARRRGGYALFQVWDTGIGISEKHINRIFEEFYQIDNPQRDRTKGLGLGLSIAKRALALLGGDITCRSKEGRGTVFEFRLPLDVNPSGPKKWVAAALPQEGMVNDGSFARGKRFVVIEDDTLVGQAMISSLEGMGGEVELFHSAEDALHDANIANADYFISDYMLGGTLNGIQLLNLLRQKLGRPINAVLTTGDTSASLYVDMTDCAWTVIHKPVKLTALLSVLRAQES